MKGTKWPQGTKLYIKLTLIRHTPLYIFVFPHPMTGHILWVTSFLLQDFFHFPRGDMFLLDCTKVSWRSTTYDVLTFSIVSLKIFYCFWVLFVLLAG